MTTRTDSIFVSLQRKDGILEPEILQLKMNDTAMVLMLGESPKYSIHWRSVRKLIKEKRSITVKLLSKACYVLNPAGSSIGTLFASMLVHLSYAQKEKQQLLEIINKDTSPCENLAEEELEKELLCQNIKKSGLHFISVETLTLPRNMLAPTTLSSKEARKAAKDRKRKRTAAAVYSDEKCYIMRSAAPKASLRSIFVHDEPNFVKAFLGKEKIKVIELRPYPLLIFDMIAGNWTEKAMIPYFSTTQFCHKGILGKSGTRNIYDKWLNGFDSHSYISFCYSALSAAVKVVDTFKAGVNVLVHCSDGWDRTAIVISLALIIMDSSQRDSIENFMKKILFLQWFSFGHPFSKRLGHRYEKHQRMPVFAIFMDILHSLVKQNQAQFGFTPEFIRFLAEEAYSMKYSNIWITRNRDERAKLEISYNQFVQDVVKVAKAGTSFFDRGSFDGVKLNNVSFRKQDSVKFWEKFGLSEVATEWEAQQAEAGENATYSSPPRSLIPAEPSSPLAATTITISVSPQASAS